MSLIRRYRPGRRSVRASLPVDARSDEAFLRALWFWLNGGEEAPKTWPLPELLRHLDGLGDHSLEALVPWLWGAWKVEPVRGRDRTFRRPRMLVSDWWAGVKDERAVEDLPRRLGEVARTAKGWHAMFEGPKTGRPLAAWAKKLIPQAFEPVVTWKDGYTWQMVRRPINNKSTPQVRVFQEIGHVLAHCYLHHGVIKHYMAQHEMMVLFDANLDPRCAFAVRVREDNTGAATWQITEQRGIYNIFPARKYWKHLADLIGVQVEDFSSFPPGFDRVPPNAGSGEPPRARDPRPDGEDPLALEVWAAGHLRRPLVSGVQMSLDRLRPKTRAKVEHVATRRRAWSPPWKRQKPAPVQAAGRRNVNAVAEARRLAGQLQAALESEAARQGTHIDDIDWRSDIDPFWQNLIETADYLGEGCGRFVVGSSDGTHAIKLPARWNAWKENRAEEMRWNGASPACRALMAPLIETTSWYVVQPKAAPILFLPEDFYRRVHLLEKWCFPEIRDLASSHNWGQLPNGAIVLLDYGFVPREDLW